MTAPPRCVEHGCSFTWACRSCSDELKEERDRYARDAADWESNAQRLEAALDKLKSAIAWSAKGEAAFDHDGLLDVAASWKMRAEDAQGRAERLQEALECILPYAESPDFSNGPPENAAYPYAEAIARAQKLLHRPLDNA